MDRSERMRINRDYKQWAGTHAHINEWRSTTDEVFQIIKKCADEECDGDYRLAWEKTYLRFLWS